MSFSVHTTIKYLRIGLIIAFAQVFFFAKCNKDPKPCLGGGGYSFLATAEWSPQQEIYRVGDTLYLTSSIPKILTDQIDTSMVVNYNNSAGINGDIPLSILDSTSKQVFSARDSFDIVAVNGRFEERKANQESGINFFYEETEQSYIFKGGLIFKKSGTYVIYVSNLFSSGLRGKNCTNASFDLSVTNSEKNFHIWQNALQRVPDEDQKKSMYCFKVL